MDELHTLQDIDASWGIQTQDPQDESDDDFDLLDDDDYEGFARERPSDVPPPYEAPDTGIGTSQVRSKSSIISTRERKGSLPLSTKSLIVGQLASTLTVSSDITRSNVDRAGHIPRNSPKDLVRLSQTLATYDPLDIAQQITKIQTDLFLAIEVRRLLRYLINDRPTLCSLDNGCAIPWGMQEKTLSESLSPRVRISITIWRIGKTTLIFIQINLVDISGQGVFVNSRSRPSENTGKASRAFH